jgi:hypothetical protein
MNRHGFFSLDWILSIGVLSKTRRSARPTGGRAAVEVHLFSHRLASDPQAAPDPVDGLRNRAISERMSAKNLPRHHGLSHLTGM